VHVVVTGFEEKGESGNGADENQDWPKEAVFG